MSARGHFGRRNWDYLREDVAFGGHTKHTYFFFRVRRRLGLPSSREKLGGPTKNSPKKKKNYIRCCVRGETINLWMFGDGKEKNWALDGRRRKRIIPIQQVVG
jgi:hypothetical protein